MSKVSKTRKLRQLLRQKICPVDWVDQKQMMRPAFLGL